MDTHAPPRRPAQRRERGALSPMALLRPSSQPETVGPPGWLRQGSPFARYALLAYVLLVFYACLYPLTGWRDVGLPFWSFVTAPWPQYVTSFDLLANVALFFPLGGLAAFAFYPLLRGWAAWLAVCVFGLLLSGAIESLQTYLPDRVASNADILTNLIGTGLGAAFGARLAPSLLERGWLRIKRMRWFEPDASGGLVIASLWCVAQWPPQDLLFGNGNVAAVLSDFYSWLFEAYGLDTFWQWTPALIEAAELMTSALGVLSIGLLLSTLLRTKAPRWATIFVLVGLTVVLKTLIQRNVFLDTASTLWLSQSAAIGIVCGLTLCGLLLHASRLVRIRLAILSLTLSLAVVNLAPESDYLAAKLSALRPFKWQWLNFSGLLDMVALVWPFAAIVYLARRRPL